MVVHCLTFANVPGFGSLLRADAWPEGIHQYLPKWSHFSIAICGFGWFWGTTIFGNIHLFILIYTYLYLFICVYICLYLFICICGVWPSDGLILHNLRGSSGSQEWSSTTGCIWCWQAGERLGAKNANPENTASRPNTRLFFHGVSWFSWPSLLNTWKLGRSKVTFKNH